MRRGATPPPYLGCDAASSNHHRSSGRFAAKSAKTVTVSSIMPVSHASPAHQKIELFRSLFRGRAEVYPQRFESRKTGRSGYSPACGNEWVRGVCEKPRIKCSDCPHQRWLPVTDNVIRWHLSGANDHGQPFVMGVYPMLLDERCWFLAADFDGENWAADARAFLDTCGRLEIPAALERSRSGNGGHVWIFFAEAVPGNDGAEVGSARVDRGDGRKAGDRISIIRPILSEPGHVAKGWIRQSHCPAIAKGGARPWE